MVNMEKLVDALMDLPDELGKGTGREGSGGADVCICPKCKYEKPHTRGVPCNDESCPKCGTTMTGKGAIGEKKIKDEGESEEPPEDNKESIENKIKLLRKNMKNMNPNAPSYQDALEEIAQLEKRLKELEKMESADDSVSERKTFKVTKFTKKTQDK